MGKGSTRRPAQIPDDQYASNYERTFGRITPDTRCSCGHELAYHDENGWCLRIVAFGTDVLPIPTACDCQSFTVSVQHRK